jgi:hypothetical protein
MLPITALFVAIHIAPAGPGLEYRQPQLAASEHIAGLTFGSGNAVYFSSSMDRGKTWTAPVKVAESGVMSLGRHRGPRIAITPQAIVISAVVGRAGKGADGDVIAWRSTDSGKTWSRGVIVNDVPAAAREGLHAMASGGGLLFASWLDLRSKGTKLYGAVSRDGGATWSRNTLVYASPDGKICECCHPSAVVASDGVIHAMWRNNLGGNRDMYTAKSSDGGETWSAAEKQGAGTWLLNACPMDGGGIGLAGGKIVSAWRRGSDIYLSGDAGSETKLEAGKDPALTVSGAGSYVVWASEGAIHARVPGKSSPLTLGQGAFPQVTAVPGGPVLAAWEGGGVIEIRELGR